ncbi:MAG: DNA alkylation repair protein [Dehalococcoidia bacterium]
MPLSHRHLFAAAEPWAPRRPRLTLRRQASCPPRSREGLPLIRKAIGSALRQYSWTDPAAVTAFVAAHEAELPPLSKREALLAISGGRKRRPATV